MSPSEYRRSEVLTGMMVVLAVAVFGLFAFRIGRIGFFDAFRGPAVECVARFTDIGGLLDGAKVSVAGRTVGEVTALEIVPSVLTNADIAGLIERGDEAARRFEPGMSRQVVEVSFAIRAPDLRLDPGTAEVRVARDGLIGQFFLDLDPGAWSGEREPAIREHDEVLRIRVREERGMEEIIAGMERTLDQTLVQAEALLTDGAQLVANVQGLTLEMTTLLKDTGPRATSLLEELDGLSRELGQTIGRVEGDVRDTLALTQDVLRENRPEVAESLRRLRRTMWEAEMAMRKIRANPAYLLFGDDEALLEASFSDEGALYRSGRATPYRQRDEGDAD